MYRQMPPDQAEFAATLAREAPIYGVALTAEQVAALTRYYAILFRWNPRLHLVAPLASDEFARRHILESLLAAHLLPEDGHIVDVGSGGGLPALPLLIARPDVHFTLLESNSKKSVFLREALAESGCASRGRAISARFEDQPQPRAAALTCRALDRFTSLLPALLAWASDINLLLLFGGEELRAHLPEETFDLSAQLIPQSERRFLYTIRRRTQNEVRNAPSLTSP